MLLDLDGEGPLYVQVYRALRAAVLSGRLRPGDRLSSSRGLARQLGVSRNVVLLAFEQLTAEGYLLSRLGSGTYVAPELPDGMAFADRRNETADKPAGEAPRLSRYGRQLEISGVKLQGGPASRPSLPYDFRRESQPPEELPLDVWRRLLSRRIARLSSRSVDYGSPFGHRPLRTAVAGYLRRARGVQCDADQVVITEGSQQALDLIVRLLLDPGEPLVLEDPHYPRARQCFMAHGARLVPVSVDDRGLRVEELDALGTGARLIYVTPSHQYPTGALLPLARRLRLLAWAEAQGVFVIEDDYDSEFRYEGRPVEAIQGLDRDGRVLYVGSFSKSLFPALRIGYVVLPPALVSSFAAAKLVCDRHSPTLMQEVLADFVEEGHFERYLRRAVARCDRRRRALLEAVDEHLAGCVEVAGTNSGLHALLWLRDVAAADAEEIVERSAAQGVGLYSVAFHHLLPPERAGLLLRYSALDEEEIRGGIERLAPVLV